LCNAEKSEFEVLTLVTLIARKANEVIVGSAGISIWQESGV
jgi:hypothetical protein